MNRSWWSLSALGLVVACVPEGKPTEGRLGIEIPEVEETSPLALTFAQAAEEFDVPVDLLKALSYSETRLVPAVGEVEFEDQPEPFGLFALRGEELTRAAVLLGVSVEEVMTDDVANVRAAASLLSAYAEEAGIDPALRPEPAVWRPALERWGQIGDQELARGFSDSVLAHVRQGLAISMLDGTTMIVGRDPSMAAEVEQGYGVTEAGIGAAGVVFRSSPNYGSRNGSRIEMVVIHTCEGAYSGCVSWLRNPQARASAHYVVNESGSEVSQLVDENNRAWHISANYRKRLNGDQLAHREGQSSNNFSVGIEHGGRGSQPSWPQGQIDRSITLVRDITQRHNIPRDRYHIVAHGRLQPESRTDPGPNWPWTSYLASISGGSTTPPPPPTTPNPPTNPTPPTNPATVITVDNRTAGRFQASGNWEVSSWAADKIGADYRFRRSAETSDLAEFRIPVPAAGRYEVFTRVPGNGYSTHAPFQIIHRGGETIVHRDLSRYGGQWLSLGTYEFNQVDDWIVKASCWTGARGYLIADAIKLEAR
ncbi:MAG: N-acetylmuramoyl-L-alanine amidase [Deltaproteobacteria bacterium]|nr:N-acetylmuramoyl-L-alanine amidase [Deltaproteobacteria bacterium]